MNNRQWNVRSFIKTSQKEENNGVTFVTMSVTMSHFLVAELCNNQYVMR